MNSKLIIDSHAFTQALDADISAARHSICVQTMSFEADEAGTWLMNKLIERPSIQRYVLIDRYSLYYHSDKFLLSPWNIGNSKLWKEVVATHRSFKTMKQAQIHVRLTNPVGPLLCNFAHRNHKKLIVIDKSISYIGGINFCDHNFSWHDLMVRIEDPCIATYLSNDFFMSFNGINSSHTYQDSDTHILSLNGTTNSTLFKPVLDTIASAKHSIFVHSAYTSYPFYDILSNAVLRGVSVNCISPLYNNKKMLAGYTRWQTHKKGINLFLYKKSMSHLKAMLIDDSVLILGSSNFDILSYHTMQDFLLISTKKDLIAEFKEQILLKDMKQCIKFTRTKRSLKDLVRYLLFSRSSKFGILVSQWWRSMNSDVHANNTNPAKPNKQPFYF